MDDRTFLYGFAGLQVFINILVFYRIGGCIKGIEWLKSYNLRKDITRGY